MIQKKTYYCSCKVCKIGMVIPANNEDEAGFVFISVHIEQCQAIKDWRTEILKRLDQECKEKFVSIMLNN